MKKIKLVVAILLLAHFFTKLYAQSMEIKANDYLEKMGKRPSGFSSEAQKLIYLARHIHEIEDYYDLATKISQIKNKSPELLEAIQEKMLQCLLHYEYNRNYKYSGILSALLDNSPNINQEYLPVLEALAKGTSKLQNPKHLKSIALEAINNTSALFSLSEKLQILANKYLLSIQPEHSGATNFFLHYPVSRSSKESTHYFMAEDNNWSGNGVVNKHGEWLLPPFYTFNDLQILFQDGFGAVRLNMPLARGGSAPSNWIDVNCRFLLPYFVTDAGPFKAGKARCKIADQTKFIDQTGTFLNIPSPENLYFFGNGYAKRIEGERVHLLDDQEKTLITLDKKYWNIQWKPKDKLFSYGSSNGWPGEGKFGYLDMQGNILTEPIYYTSSDYDYDSGSFNGQEVMVLSLAYQREGLVDKAFRTLIPFNYDKIRIINRKYVVARRGNNYSLFDHAGKIVAIKTPKAFTWENYIIYSGPLGITQKDSTYQIIDEDGQPIPELENIQAGELKYGLISLKKGKWGVLDTQFREVIPFIYDRIFLISGTTVLTELKGQLQCHNISTGTTYDIEKGTEIGEYFAGYNDQSIVLRKNDKEGIVNTEGKVVLPFVFYHIRPGWRIAP